MTAIGIAMVRDEADVIGSVVRHMLTQVDHVLIADNGSIDGTRDILDELPVEVIDDPERGYYQSRKMTSLAMEAGKRGAEWIVPFDADEIVYSPFGRVAGVLEDLAPQWLVASSELYDHVATGADPKEDDPVLRIGWRRRQSVPLVKVACRYRHDLVVEQGNHAASYDGGSTVFPGLLVTRHFPYRSVEQFISKVRNGAQAYAATDLPEEVGAHWRRYGDILHAFGEEGLAEVFRKWFWVGIPQAEYDLIYDPAPV